MCLSTAAEQYRMEKAECLRMASKASLHDTWSPIVWHGRSGTRSANQGTVDGMFNFELGEID